MKKVLALLLALAMVLSLAACGGSGSSTTTTGAASGSDGSSDTQGSSTSLEGTYDVTLWIPEAIVELTKQQVEDFNSSNTYGITINATVEAVSEADSATNMITDVEAGADIYFFAQDQFMRLVQAGALAKLGTAAAATVTESNSADTVTAATTGGEMYAYPLTADNGYFMYYDKSVIPEEDIDSMEALIADCEAAGKYFAMETNTSAWYLAAFFFATGCVSEWTTDSDGNFVSVHDTFNSDEGLIAAKGIQKLVTSSANLSSSQAEFASGAAVVVTGIWNYETISEQLGDNMGVADLPSFEVDGVSYHLSSYSGCKLLGVKPQTDAVRQAVLHQLAQYLTNEQCQLERFELASWGPSNLAAQENEAVQANAGLSALMEQNQYAVPQGQIHGSWWDICKVIADDVKAATTDEELQQALVNYEEKINTLFTMDEATLNAYTVIGSINGDTWSVDLSMTSDGDIWTTTEAYTMDAGVEFKVRKGLSWDEAYPADNYVVETAGTYYIQFDASTGEVSLIDG